MGLSSCGRNGCCDQALKKETWIILCVDEFRCRLQDFGKERGRGDRETLGVCATILPYKGPVINYVEGGGATKW